MNQLDPNFLAPRRCMREPIEEIFLAAELLNRATDAHLAGDRIEAEALITRADIPAIRAWQESLWGSKAANPDQWQFHRYRAIANAPPMLARDERLPQRMPSSADRAALIKRYGRNCCFCGIPVIRAEVRAAFTRNYPDAAYWRGTKATQHAALQCLWLQFDHILPHSRGGDNSIENLIITCAACNFGRMQWTLEQVGLIDPRGCATVKMVWDGLERFLNGKSPLKSPG